MALLRSGFKLRLTVFCLSRPHPHPSSPLCPPRPSLRSLPPALVPSIGLSLCAPCSSRRRGATEEEKDSWRSLDDCQNLLQPLHPQLLHLPPVYCYHRVFNQASNVKVTNGGTGPHISITVSHQYGTVANGGVFTAGKSFRGTFTPMLFGSDLTKSNSPVQTF